MPLDYIEFSKSVKIRRIIDTIEERRRANRVEFSHDKKLISGSLDTFTFTFTCSFSLRNINPRKTFRVSFQDRKNVLNKIFLLIYM